jgi:arginase family enzyme
LLENRQMIFDAAYANALQSHLTLLLGGDHSVGIGSVAAALKARPDVGVIWVVSGWNGVAAGPYSGDFR